MGLRWKKLWGLFEEGTGLFFNLVSNLLVAVDYDRYFCFLLENLFKEIINIKVAYSFCAIIHSVKLFSDFWWVKHLDNQILKSDDVTD